MKGKGSKQTSSPFSPFPFGSPIPLSNRSVLSPGTLEETRGDGSSRTASPPHHHVVGRRPDPFLQSSGTSEAAAWMAPLASATAASSTSSSSALHHVIRGRIRAQDVYGGTPMFGGSARGTTGTVGPAAGSSQRRSRLFSASPYHSAAAGRISGRQANRSDRQHNFSFNPPGPLPPSASVTSSSSSTSPSGSTASSSTTAAVNRQPRIGGGPSSSPLGLDGMSATARLILGALDRMSTPLLDAQKMIPAFPVTTSGAGATTSDDGRSPRAPPASLSPSPNDNRLLLSRSLPVVAASSSWLQAAVTAGSPTSRAEKRRLIAQELDASMWTGGASGAKRARRRPSLGASGSSVMNGPPLRSLAFSTPVVAAPGTGSRRTLLDPVPEHGSVSRPPVETDASLVSPALEATGCRPSKVRLQQRTTVLSASSGAAISSSSIPHGETFVGTAGPSSHRQQPAFDAAGKFVPQQMQRVQESSIAPKTDPTKPFGFGKLTSTATKMTFGESANNFALPGNVAPGIPTALSTPITTTPATTPLGTASSLSAAATTTASASAPFGRPLQRPSLSPAGVLSATGSSSRDAMAQVRPDQALPKHSVLSGTAPSRPPPALPDVANAVAAASGLFPFAIPVGVLGAGAAPSTTTTTTSSAAKSFFSFCAPIDVGSAAPVQQVRQQSLQNHGLGGASLAAAMPDLTRPAGPLPAPPAHSFHSVISQQHQRLSAVNTTTMTSSSSSQSISAEAPPAAASSSPPSGLLMGFLGGDFGKSGYLKKGSVMDILGNKGNNLHKLPDVTAQAASSSTPGASGNSSLFQFGNPGSGSRPSLLGSNARGSGSGGQGTLATAPSAAQVGWDPKLKANGGSPW